MADERKAALRKTMLERRDALSDDMIRICSERIRRALRRVPEFAGAAALGAYYPIGSEVRTQKIIQDALAAGARVCLPRIDGGALDFRAIAGFADLERGRLGTMEPKETCPPAEPGAVLVPAVCASPDRYRLGYGRGFYDRHLQGSGAFSIAVCAQRQVVKSVPHEPHDARVDAVVTDERVYR